MSKIKIAWGFRMEGGRYAVWMGFPDYRSGEVQIGTLERDGRKWVPVKNSGKPLGGSYRTGKAATLALVEDRLKHATNGLRGHLIPHQKWVWRKNIDLTPEQLNRVWDVLVEFWYADEDRRKEFVAAGAEKPVVEFRCGLGKFYQSYVQFGLRMSVDDVTPWSEYVMVKAALELQKLYQEFFNSGAVGVDTP